MDSKEIQELVDVIEKVNLHVSVFHMKEDIDEFAQAIHDARYRKLSSMPELEKEITAVLVEYFHDPIDEPCPYCEAKENIMQLFQSKLNDIKDRMKLISDEVIFEEIQMSPAVVDSYNRNIQQVCKDVAQAQLTACLKAFEEE